MYINIKKYIYDIHIYINIIGPRARNPGPGTKAAARDAGRDPGQRGGTQASGVGPGLVGPGEGPIEPLYKAVLKSLLIKICPFIC